MQVVTQNKYTEEAHRWNHHIPAGATKLFIGTFPTEERNRKHDFFYSSATNRFWEVVTALAQPLGKIADEKDEVEKRKLILHKLHLGLTDMGKKVLRQQGSSNDHSLFPLEFMNIIELVQQHPAIDTLIVSGNTQGNSSLSWFSTFCQLNNIKVNAKQIEEEKTGSVVINGKPYKVVIAFSPSRQSRKKTEVLIESYRALLLS